MAQQFKYISHCMQLKKNSIFQSLHLNKPNPKPNQVNAHFSPVDFGSRFKWELMVDCSSNHSRKEAMTGIQYWFYYNSNGPLKKSNYKRKDTYTKFLKMVLDGFAHTISFPDCKCKTTQKSLAFSNFHPCQLTAAVNLWYLLIYDVRPCSILLWIIV